MLFGQLGVLALWVTAVIIAGRVRARGVKNSFDAFVSSLGDPRRIVYAGLGLHAVLLLSGLMMLEHIGEREGAGRIRAALEQVLVDGTVRTRDLGGTATTTEFTDAVCRRLE